MITEAIIAVMCFVVSAIGSMFPDANSPGWWSSIESASSTLAGYASGFGSWIPFGAVGNAMQFVVFALGAAALIKIIRVVASFATAGGGSAA